LPRNKLRFYQSVANGGPDVAGVKGTALITGASSGIGLEFARAFAAGGFDLVLVAPGEDKLKALAAEVSARETINARVLAADLGEVGAAARIFARLQSDGTKIDVLVNNAGFGARGIFATLPRERQLEMVQVNVVALTDLTRLFLPDMLQRRRGRILNVASVAGFQPGPYMAVYYATKAYVLSLSEALSKELSGSGVTVTCLCPGPTETGFAAAADLEGSLLFRLAVANARDVARAGYDAAMAGKRLVVPGFLNRFAVFAVRVAPRGLVLSLIKRLQK